MATCDVAHGRLEACKDAMSGIDAIYFINYGIQPQDVTTGANDIITQIAGVTHLYKYELKGANTLDTTIQTSRDNGTTYWEQVLSIQLKTQDLTTQQSVKMLAYGRPHIVVQTRSEQYFMVGLRRGADLTAGNIASGTGPGDFNGYGLTFTAMEKEPANFIDATDDTDLSTNVFMGAQIVTI